jgi:glucosamine-6-phosphate deaminase
MKIFFYENSKIVAQALEEQLEKRAAQRKLRIFLPTGRTPQNLYALLREDASFWKTRMEGIQIDEFIDPSRPFLRQLERELVTPVGISLSSWDPTLNFKAIEDYTHLTLERPIDVALLGLGPNGHVGFHEPGISKSFVGGPQEITEETRSRVKGPTSKVLTFGVGAFMKAKEIFLIVTGEEKREIFEKLQVSEPTEDLPASLLKMHKKFFVFTDLN